MPRIKRRTRRRAHLTPDQLTIPELLALKCGWSPTSNTRWHTREEVAAAWADIAPQLPTRTPGASRLTSIDPDDPHWAAREFGESEAAP